MLTAGMTAIRLGANGVAFKNANTPNRIVMAQRMRLRVMSVIGCVSRVST